MPSVIITILLSVIAYFFIGAITVFLYTACITAGYTTVVPYRVEKDELVYVLSLWPLIWILALIDIAYKLFAWTPYKYGVKLGYRVRAKRRDL